MSSSYERVLYGASPGNASFSPVADVPVNVNLGASPRKAQPSSVRPSGGLRGGPLAGVGSFTDAVISNAKGNKKPGDGNVGNAIDTGMEKWRNHAFGPEDAVADHIAQAESTAAQPSGRHAYVIPRTGEAVTATRNSRGYPQYPDADGPLGSTGVPAGGGPYGSSFAGLGWSE